MSWLARILNWFLVKYTGTWMGAPRDGRPPDDR